MADDDVKFLVGWQLAFSFRLDLYLSAAQIKEDKPALKNVKAKSSYVIGNRGYISFLGTGDREWLLDVDHIVAARYRLDADSSPDAAAQAQMQSELNKEARGRNSNNDEWESWRQLGDAAYNMFSDPTELYLQSGDVAAATPTLVIRDVSGYYMIHHVPFVRFRPLERDNPTRWIVNINHLAAARLVHEELRTGSDSTKVIPRIDHPASQPTESPGHK